MRQPILLGGAAALALVLGSGAQAADPQHGKAVFQIWCTGCHAPLPGTSYAPPAGSYVLQQRYQGAKPAALEQRTDLQDSYIKATVRSGRGMMPATRKTEVSDADLADLAAYLSHTN